MSNYSHANMEKMVNHTDMGLTTVTYQDKKFMSAIPHETSLLALRISGSRRTFTIIFIPAFHHVNDEF